MTGVIDRSPKPCLHKIANHEHGTRNAYTSDRCRCLPCCYAMSRYETDRTKRNAYGRSNLVDATPVREHVRALMAAGVGLKRIVKVSGVAQGTLWKLIYGKNGGTPSRRVTRGTAARLLALSPGDLSLLADGARIPSLGTQRRLQSLACIGWSVHRLAAEACLDRQALDQALRGERITTRTARAVAAAYERLWASPPATSADHRDQAGVARTVRHARQAGWAPPLAWDEDTIDDPTATPALGDDSDLVDELAVALVLEGERMTLTGATLHAAVHALTDAGHLPASIAERLGIDERQVYRLRGRATPPRHWRAAA